MAGELHLSNQPVQVPRHLEGMLVRLLIPCPQTKGSLPLLLLPANPVVGEHERLHVTTVACSWCRSQMKDRASSLCPAPSRFSHPFEQ